MKVIDIRATDGPNYWSVHRHQLIVMLLDLEEMEQQPTNEIHGFYDRIVSLLPSLYEHQCSEGVPGGFFQRVNEGTWMGHVIEHIALEIQSLAGMFAGFGRTRGAGGEGLYHVAFAYVDEEAGRYAAQAAVRIAEALIKGDPYDVAQDIEAMRAIRQKNKMGPSTCAIMEEARRRNIPVLRLGNESMLQLGYGAAQRRIEATVASTTCQIAVEMASDKAVTKQHLEACGIPVPHGETIKEEGMLMAAVKRTGYPLVIKPLNGNHGKGATINIRSMEEALKAFRVAKAFGGNVICEGFVQGLDFRVLVINYQFVAAAWRLPAAVTGDGVHTVQELVDMVNQDPKRGNGHENMLTQIIVDEASLQLLARQGYRLNSIPPAGRNVRLKATANLSTGGTAVDVTDLVHPDNKALFERIARNMMLDICGIDVMAPSLSEPVMQNGGKVLEVNAGPGFRMHLEPTQGLPRNVAKPVIDMLFPDGASGRIPIIAITGTNGKTTTTRLIAHIMQQAGYKTGFTTTDGVYIHGHQVMKGDCTGPYSARIVLKDPGVNMAVLECARGGILRGGLGFDQCDIGIVTNVAPDHLGLGGIDTLEKLVKVKSVVAEAVAPDGFAILNADDENVVGMREKIRGRCALYSMRCDNPHVCEHVRAGGIAAVYDDGHIAIMHRDYNIRLDHVMQIPITMGGKATFNIANALAASLAAYIQRIDVKDIVKALRSFIPSAEMTPGRMNIFDFTDFKVIVDYAHNQHGVQAMGEFLKTIDAGWKRGVIAGIGDRRDEDITGLAMEAAKIFDEIIIRHDKDLRGRTAAELERLLCSGVQQVDPHKKITIISDEAAAVDFVVKYAPKGSVSVVFVDNVQGVLQQLQQAKAERANYTSVREVA